jgi:hypothetical protein
MKDLTNIAYSDEYTELKNRIINSAYSHVNRKRDSEIIEGNLKRIIEEYRTNDNKYFCSNNKVYDGENKLLFEYFNLYHHNFFCKEIKYNDGKYIFYKTALYGYNVFETNTGKTFEYFPKCSFGENGVETFIATHIFFNKNNNMFAVEGCYWACPVDTFLIKIDSPLKQFDGYVNIHLIVDEDYQKYDDISFVKWENNNIEVSCLSGLEKETIEEIITLSEKEYMKKLIFSIFRARQKQSPG